VDVIYRIDIERNGRRTGTGPIKSVMNWTTDQRLGEVGEFTCSIAATDEQAEFIQPYSALVCRVLVQGRGFIEIGRGEVRDIKTTIAPDGKAIIEVSGPDGAVPLTERSVVYTEIGNEGNPVTLTEALGFINEWITDWTLINAVGSEPSIFYEFAGETVLAALAKFGELTDTHTIVDPSNKTVTFKSNGDFEDCGIRAIATPSNPDPLDPHTCYIVGSPVVREETGDMYTMILPYGFGRAEKSVNLAASTIPIDPNVYEIDRSGTEAGNYIRHKIKEAEIGRSIVKFKKFQDIELVLPDGFDDTENPYPNKEAVKRAAEISASNALLTMAIRALDEAVNGIIHYDLSLLHCNKIVKPGQKIRCVFSYRFGPGWVKVDRMLNITATKMTADNSGIRTTDLTVSPTSRPPRLDADPLLKTYAWMNRL
jgi:hypothetical protein